MNPSQHLVAACGALVLLTIVVGIRMLQVRIREMKTKRIAPQKTALSGKRASLLKDSRASDNYNHLYELPVLFYVLCALAVGSNHVPDWLPYAAWLFVILRVIHSIIQCGYNKVMHRFSVFLLGFATVAVMWTGFVISYLTT